MFKNIKSRILKNNCLPNPLDWASSANCIILPDLFVMKMEAR